MSNPFLGQVVCFRVNAGNSVKVGVVVDVMDTDCRINCLSEPGSGWAGMTTHPYYTSSFVDHDDGTSAGICFPAVPAAQPVTDPIPADAAAPVVSAPEPVAPLDTGSQTQPSTFSATAPSSDPAVQPPGPNAADGSETDAAVAPASPAPAEEPPAA